MNQQSEQRSTTHPVTDPKTRITHCIDWLTVTYPCDLGIQNVYPVHSAFETTGEVLSTNWRNYTRLMKFNHGKILWNPERPEQRICVEYSARGLFDLHQAGLLAETLLAHALECDGNITRLDFAVDYFGPSSPQELYDEAEAGRVKTRAHTYSSWKTTKLKKRGAGDDLSFYLGSNKSARTLRCYDKAKKLRVSGPRTRLELTMREGLGNRVAAAMLQAGMGPAGKSAIRDFFQCDVDWFKEAVEGESVNIPDAPYKEPKTREWLMDSVTKSLSKQVIADAAEENFEILERYCLLLEGLKAEYLQPGHPLWS